MTVPADLLRDALAALADANHGATWIASAMPGKSAIPLRFLPDDSGFVELLRMAPGVAMPPHRHTGDTHVFHLAGSRRLPSGEVIGPAGYEFEPAGTVDSWVVIGDQALVALVIVMGTVEFLDANGDVRAIVTAATQREEFERHCRKLGMPAPGRAPSAAE